MVILVIPNPCLESIMIICLLAIVCATIAILVVAKVMMEEWFKYPW